MWLFSMHTPCFDLSLPLCSFHTFAIKKEKYFLFEFNFHSMPAMNHEPTNERTNEQTKRAKEQD